MHNFKAVLLIGLYILKAAYAAEYNVALNKAVTTINNVTDHPATMANDQDINTYAQTYSVANSIVWIQFDLKGVYFITKIIIWPTNDNDFSLARVYAYVRLTKSTAYDHRDVFCQYNFPAKGIAFNCSNNNNIVKGRYVLLKKESDFAVETLKIAEIAILTEDMDFIVSITTIPVQNNDYRNYIASNAVDGNLATCINTAQDQNIQNRNIPGWWKADLGDDYQVSSVRINDYSGEYKGNYLIYIDPTDSKLNLCAYLNQTSPQADVFLQAKCGTVLTGRYLTVEKIFYEKLDVNIYRPDALCFCEIEVITSHKDTVFVLPNNYNTSPASTTKNTPFTTTKPILPSSPTDPFTATEATSTSTTTYLIFIDDTCSNNCSSCQQKMQLNNLQQENSSLQKEKIVIGVVVGVLAIIVGAILGFIAGNIYQKKKSVKVSEATIYEKAKEENIDQHAYSEINNTALTEIQPYYSEIK